MHQKPCFLVVEGKCMCMYTHPYTFPPASVLAKFHGWPFRVFNSDSFFILWNCFPESKFILCEILTLYILIFKFSRSSVGGSKYFLDSCPCGDKVDGLRFESRFESGNLAKVVKITDNYYELYLRTDMYTNRHMQWYYFRVENTKRRVLYR